MEISRLLREKIKILQQVACSICMLRKVLEVLDLHMSEGAEPTRSRQQSSIFIGISQRQGSKFRLFLFRFVFKVGVGGLEGVMPRFVPS